MSEKSIMSPEEGEKKMITCGGISAMSEVLFDADLKKALRIVLEWAEKIGLITSNYFQDKMKTISRFSGDDYWDDWDEWEKEHLAETQPAEG